MKVHRKLLEAYVTSSIKVSKTIVNHVTNQLGCSGSSNNTTTTSDFHYTLGDENLSWSGFGTKVFAISLAIELVTSLINIVTNMKSSFKKSRERPIDYSSLLLDYFTRFLELIIFALVLTAMYFTFNRSFNVPKVHVHHSLENYGGRVVIASNNITAMGDSCVFYEASTVINNCHVKLQRAIEKEHEYKKCMDSYSDSNYLDCSYVFYQGTQFESLPATNDGFWKQKYKEQTCSFVDSTDTLWNDRYYFKYMTYEDNGAYDFFIKPRYRKRLDERIKNSTLVDCTKFAFEVSIDTLIYATDDTPPKYRSCESLTTATINNYTCFQLPVASIEKTECIDNFIEHTLQNDAWNLADDEIMPPLKAINVINIPFWYLFGYAVKLINFMYSKLDEETKKKVTFVDIDERIVSFLIYDTLNDLSKFQVDERIVSFAVDGWIYYMLKYVSKFQVIDGCMALLPMSRFSHILGDTDEILTCASLFLFIILPGLPIFLHLFFRVFEVAAHMLQLMAKNKCYVFCLLLFFIFVESVRKPIVICFIVGIVVYLLHPCYSFLKWLVEDFWNNLKKIGQLCAKYFFVSTKFYVPGLGLIMYGSVIKSVYDALKSYFSKASCQNDALTHPILIRLVLSLASISLVQKYILPEIERVWSNPEKHNEDRNRADYGSTNNNDEENPLM